MFERFPKSRPPLPKAIADIYATQYKANREGATAASSLSQKMETWMHRQVARDIVANPAVGATLEIGAGTLNQLAYEPLAKAYDIVEPFKELYSASASLGRIRKIYADISEIPASTTYSRITSIAAFEHICNLPDVVGRAALLLEPQGALRVAIPSEGTPLWTLGWKMTTGLEFRIKHGLDYGQLVRHEHVNTAAEIEELLRYFFERVETRLFGVTRSLSLYQFHVCSAPRLDRCADRVAS